MRHAHPGQRLLPSARCAGSDRVRHAGPARHRLPHGAVAVECGDLGLREHGDAMLLVQTTVDVADVWTECTLERRRPRIAIVTSWPSIRSEAATSDAIQPPPTTRIRRSFRAMARMRSASSKWRRFTTLEIIAWYREWPRGRPRCERQAIEGQ